MSITRTARSKWQLGAAAAKDLYSSMSCKFLARETRMIYFPKEGKWIETPNIWRLGWSQDRRAWVASNRTRAWRFKDLGALVEFRDFLAARDWAVSRA